MLPSIKYILHHTYIKEGGDWPAGVPHLVGVNQWGIHVIHMEGRDMGTGLDVWWTESKAVEE